MSEKALFEALGARASLLQQGGVGNVFFVDGYGDVFSDDNDGTRERPFRTIKFALSQCVDWHHDVIIVLNYWQPTGEDWPILINKKNVHIIGAALPNLQWPVIHPPADDEVFKLTSSGQNSEIAFLTFGGGNTHGGISIGDGLGTCDGYYIHHCLFGHPWFGTPGSGIYQPVGASHGGEAIRIEHCRFLGDEGGHIGAISGNAIDLLKAANMNFLEILDCIFSGCTVAMNLVQPIDAVILRNMIGGLDGVAGMAITLGAGALGCMIDGNSVMADFGGAALGANPYLDNGGANANRWGVNYSGGVAVAAA